MRRRNGKEGSKAATRPYSGRLRVAMDLSQLFGKIGRWDEALDLLALVYDRFTEGSDTTDLKRPKMLLGALT